MESIANVLRLWPEIAHNTNGQSVKVASVEYIRVILTVIIPQQIIYGHDRRLDP